MTHGQYRHLEELKAELHQLRFLAEQDEQARHAAESRRDKFNIWAKTNPELSAIAEPPPRHVPGREMNGVHARLHELHYRIRDAEIKAGIRAMPSVPIGAAFDLLVQIGRDLREVALHTV
jgi:hypothetical protein